MTRSQELNQLLAILTSFADAPVPAMPADIDWPEIVELTERHGLAAIASYQLEYRLVSSWRVPSLARERLLLTFNGLLNDNVHKLSRLKQLLSQEGAPAAILLGAASLADAFYPHIAFRPVESIDLLVRKDELERAQHVFREGGLRQQGARLGDGEIDVQLWTRPPGLSLSAGDLDALWERRLAVRPYGPNAFRPAPADALLLQVAVLAQEAFQVVRVLLVDLREMALRGFAGESFYGPGGDEVLDRGELLARARAWRLGRSLYASLALVGELFPEAAGAARAISPEVPARARAFLQRAIVAPAVDPRQQNVFRAGQAARRMLLRG